MIVLGTVGSYLALIEEMIKLYLKHHFEPDSNDNIKNKPN
jgi:hypothetical protein